MEAGLALVRVITLRALVVLVLISSHAFSFEVGSDFSSDSGLLDQFIQLEKTFGTAIQHIQENGTTVISNAVATRAVEAVLASKNPEYSPSNDSTSTISRGPAVVSAGNILRVGEQIPESYPSFAQGGIGAGGTLNSDPFEQVSGIGNAGKVFETLKPLDRGLPIPVAQVVPPTPKGYVPPSGTVKEVDPDSAGSPYTAGAQTSFGTNPSDTSILNLIKGQKKDTLSQLADLQERDLQALKEKDKEDQEEEERLKKEAELKEAIEEIKDMKTPYTMSDYEKVRGLFLEDPKQIQGLTKNDDLFAERAADVFKELENRDKNEALKRPYRDFYDKFVDQQSKPFPGKANQVPVRSRTETVHTD